MHTYHTDNNEHDNNNCYITHSCRDARVRKRSCSHPRQCAEPCVRTPASPQDGQCLRRVPSIQL